MTLTTAQRCRIFTAEGIQQTLGELKPEKSPRSNGVTVKPKGVTPRPKRVTSKPKGATSKPKVAKSTSRKLRPKTPLASSGESERSTALVTGSTGLTDPTKPTRSARSARSTRSTNDITVDLPGYTSNYLVSTDSRYTEVYWVRTSQLWNIKEYDRYTSPRHGDSEYLQKLRDWFTERPYHHTWAMDMETPMSWSARGLGVVQVDPDSRKVCLIEGCHRVLLLREKGETFFPSRHFYLVSRPRPHTRRLE